MIERWYGRVYFIDNFKNPASFSAYGIFYETVWNSLYILENKIPPLKGLGFMVKCMTYNRFMMTV